MSLPSSSSGSNDNSGKSSRDPAEDVGHADVDDDDDEDEEFYDADPLPIVGRCRALYPFEGDFLMSYLTLLLVLKSKCFFSDKRGEHSYGGK
jgi:hypothetical protein